MYRQLGDGNFREGLHDRIRANTTFQRDHQLADSPKRIRTYNIIKRGPRYVRQVSYTKSRGESPGRFLLQNLPSTQERRKVETGYRSQASQSVHKEAEVQNVDVGQHYTGRRPGRLVDINRSKRRLFSHSHIPSTLEVSPIRSGERSIRVQGSPVRDNDGSQGVHQDAGTDIRVHPEEDRPIQLTIPRRFFNERQGKVVFSIKIPGGHRLHAKNGPDNQLGKVRAGAGAGQGPYRGTLQNGGGNCDSAGGQDHQYHQPCQDDSEVFSDISQKLSQTVGATQQQHISSGMGEIICEADTALPAGPLETEQRGPSGHDSRQGGVKATSQLVEVRGQSEDGDSTGSGETEVHVGNRCKFVRLGSLPGVRGRDEWRMVRIGVPESHQLAGVKSGVQRASLLPEVLVGEDDSPGKERQQHGGLVYQQTGRNEVVIPVLPDMGGVELVQGQAGLADSNLHTRAGEHTSGSTVERGSPSRVVPVSSGGEGSLLPVGNSSHRPVCQQSEQQGSDLLLQGERSTGLRGRRPQPELGQSRSVCFSPGTLNSEGPTKGKGQQRKGDPGGSKQGQEALDVDPHRPAGRHTTGSSKQKKASKNDGVAEVSPGTRKSKFSCLENRRRKLQGKGFRREAAELATNDVRESTVTCYNSRVQAYIRWCDKNRVKNPIASSVASVCNFLYELYNEGKAARTIGGYIAAISKWHDRVHGRRLCNVAEIIGVRKATAIARPPKKVHFQTWNLPLVLQGLTREPFEPLNSATLKFLSLKTVFLVACSTARRCSEIGALSVEKDKFFMRPQGVEVGYVAGFIPKNARVNYAGKTVYIPRFSDMASCEEEIYLCPRRAVKIYKDRTDLYRKSGEKRLFVTYGAGEEQGKGASKKTLARWIVQTIQFAYANSNLEDRQVTGVKAHSVRSAATTFAFLKGVRVQHILEAADWASPTTFINHYFRPGEGPGQEFAASVLKGSKQ